MTERTTIRLPDELVRRAKRKAAAEGRSLTALIEDALRRLLSEQPAAARTPHRELPVSRETGGLMPGIDLNQTAELQAMEDQRDAERLR